MLKHVTGRSICRIVKIINGGDENPGDIEKENATYCGNISICGYDYVVCLWAWSSDNDFMSRVVEAQKYVTCPACRAILEDAIAGEIEYA